jgi:hypothetical protein
MTQKYSGLAVGYVDFNHVNDIERGEACKQWIIAINKEDNE